VEAETASAGFSLDALIMMQVYIASDAERTGQEDAERTRQEILTAKSEQLMRYSTMLPIFQREQGWNRWLVPLVG
jgi:hypothetical protein